jgi:hypothetical protein
VKKKRFPFFSARGLLARALALVPIHAALLWYLAGKNIVAALLAPSEQMGHGTAAIGVLFALVRLMTIFVLPGLVVACVGVILLNRLTRPDKPLEAKEPDSIQE